MSARVGVIFVCLHRKMFPLTPDIFWNSQDI